MERQRKKTGYKTSLKQELYRNQCPYSSTVKDPATRLTTSNPGPGTQNFSNLKEHRRHLKTLSKNADSNSLHLVGGPKCCISKKLPGDTEATGPQIILGETSPDFCFIYETKCPVVPSSDCWVSVLFSCSESLGR